ncbi:ATP-dependent DNA helicase PIF1 [Metarhizium guizhouense ARSEF 977]|uniref:ATP-dependent DNA helicase n=1 Tax=Metarhizium guizhouense (strain ARSEF 977) TaxID=1276136 RepID=A0A0B4G4Y0_METGA|nr:ATP-dependent DNA helicase PIF1 [Metarhizium guizhouense ARSEF 977]
MTRRKSTNPTTTCLKCRDYRNSERARSRGAIQILRNLAVRPERPAPKRTDREAGLSPGKERSGTQPTSPERLRQPPTARRLFGKPISQPRVVLGTPIPPTQSSPLYRTLAPSPPVQPTAYPIASHPDPSTIRSSTPSIPGVDYSYLAARFHRGGKVSQDDSSKAWARAKQAAIQRDHRSRRRAGETVSLTPTISQLGAIEDFEGPGEDGGQDQPRPNGSSAGDGMIKEGDDGGEFSESDIDVEDYFNLLLSPTRPRGYLEQLGIESDSDPGDEDEGDNNDGVDESPLRRRLRQTAAQSRRGRRGPAPGTGGRPRKSRRQSRSSIPPRRVRSPVIIPPEESAVFHAQDPVWNGDLDASALSDRDKATLREFWTMLDNDQMEYCSRCQESWFQMKIDTDGICGRCYRRDAKRRPGEPYFFSADNQLDFGSVPARLPQLTPTEESLIARVHVHVNIMLVRGQQYKYRGHVVHFLREVGLVYNQLPLLPQELNTVSVYAASRSPYGLTTSRHHPGYRCIIIDEDRLSQLPEDGSVLDAIPQSQVEAADVGPEEDQEAEPDVEDEAAVPDLLAKDTELDALRSILAGEPEVNPGLATVDAQTRPELRLPNIRRTPINEFNRSHALLSLAFPCLFPNGRADFVEPRLRSIDYKDYVEHAMRWHDGRFARHPTFRFVAFNTMMRSQARTRSNFFVKQHHGMHQLLTQEQLIQALEHSDDPEAQALINSITRHAVSIRGTRPFWNRKRQDLVAYAYNLGCPGAFITFSSADLHWRSLYQHMPRYEEWLAASEPERMALSRHLLRQNPHIAAFHFYRRYCFFRDIVLSKKFKITDYWDRYEWQGRGSPHNHGLYWMENCPRVDMEDEAARDVFARTWGFHITAINPEPSRTMPQGEGNPLSVDPLSTELTFLRLSRIVNRCQRHRCNTTYCLRVKKRTVDLARDMEGAAADIEVANAANPEREKEGKSYYVFEAARNDNLMNHFNPAIILGWLGNIDISPCTSLQAVITYAAKYCSKSEKKTEPYWTPVSRAAPTGVAGNQISGTTLHSLLHLPINKDFKPLSPIDMAQLQKKLKDIKYLIIDEKSMLGLRQLSWIGDPLREAFPSRNEEFFGSLNVLLVGDFFQLPPVLQKPLYYDKEVQGAEIKGRNAYRRFHKSVFLKVVQRQRGDDQKAFRTALEELRLLQLSVGSWKLLSSPVQAKLDDQEVARFANALRVYATKDRVNEYSHYHLDRLSRLVIQVKAKNVGLGAAAAPDDKAGNHRSRSLFGLCNGARGTVYDIGWAPGADPVQDPPCVIMMEFDKYSGPVFLTTPDGRKIVPILPVDRDFLIGSTLGTRIQFPLIVCYAITVHNSQASLKMSS